jgi:glycosyltransferase involved in cell wall biosynthesis
MHKQPRAQPVPALQVPRVTQEFFPVASGPANQALALSRELERLGIASPILTTTTDETREALAGVTVRRFRPILSAPNFRPSLALQRSLMCDRASAIHIHGWRNPVSDGAIFAAQRRRIPIVLQAHGVAFGHRFAHEGWPIRVVRQTYDASIREFVIRNASVVVASTQAEAAELRDYGFPTGRIVVIPVGIDDRFFTGRNTDRPVEPGKLKLLTVGRIGPRRNIEQIIRALALLRAWGIQAQLRVVGPEVRLAAGERLDYRQQLEALAHQLGIAGDVVFTGPRYGTALLEEYRSADIFICTTLYENFGQPIAEAAAMGLPIVATPTGVAPDLVVDAGLIVPFHDTTATAMALQRFHIHSGLLYQLGQAAKVRAAQEFRWKTIVQRYLSLYITTASQSAWRTKRYD